MIMISIIVLKIVKHKTEKKKTNNIVIIWNKIINIVIK